MAVGNAVAVVVAVDVGVDVIAGVDVEVGVELATGVADGPLGVALGVLGTVGDAVIVAVDVLVGSGVRLGDGVGPAVDVGVAADVGVAGEPEAGLISTPTIAQSTAPENDPFTATVPLVVTALSSTAALAALPLAPCISSPRSVYPLPGVCVRLRMAAAPNASALFVVVVRFAE